MYGAYWVVYLPTTHQCDTVYLYEGNILPYGGRGEAGYILSNHDLVVTGGNMVHK